MGMCFKQQFAHENLNTANKGNNNSTYLNVIRICPLCESDDGNIFFATGGNFDSVSSKDEQPKAVYGRTALNVWTFSLCNSPSALMAFHTSFYVFFFLSTLQDFPFRWKFETALI